MELGVYPGRLVPKLDLPLHHTVTSEGSLGVTDLLLLFMAFISLAATGWESKLPGRIKAVESGN